LTSQGTSDQIPAVPILEQEVVVNKSDVIDRVVGASGVGRQQAENVIDAFFDTVRSAAKGGDRVAWPGFGSFSTTQRKARTGRNPRTGESVKIPASKAVKFSASSTLKEFLNAGGAKKSAAAKKAAKKAGGGAKKATAAPAKKAAAKKSTAAAAPAKKSGAAKKSAPAKKATKGR
jgi:DNA-binding protein HU-beta